MDQHESSTVLSKLTRRPASAAALTIIGITILVSVFAYVLAPDDTPGANTMIVELGARQPGFSTKLLRIPLPIALPSEKSISIFSGTPAHDREIPVNGYRFAGDKVIVRHYIDDGLEDTLSFPLRMFLPAADTARMDLTAREKYFEKHAILHRTFYLGTDRYGRDILSRLLIGSRVTMAVGLTAMLLSLTIGIVLGALAGYFGGMTDNVVMWFVNIVYAIPTLLLVFSITLTIGKGFMELFVAIGLGMWVGAARLIRGQVMAIKEMDYVTAARALGLGNMRIIFRHILPNIAGPVMVIAAANFASAILIESGLSFLGFGVQPPNPSWGLMIKEHYNFLLTSQPMPAIIPGLAIMVLVFAFNVLGNALRDVLDVRG